MCRHRRRGRRHRHRHSRRRRHRRNTRFLQLIASINPRFTTGIAFRSRSAPRSFTVRL